MSTPYANLSQFTVNIGVANTLKIPVPNKGTLVRLVIADVSASNAGFSYSLYDRKSAAPGQTPAAEMLPGIATPVVVNASLHLLIAATVLAAPGNTVTLLNLVIPYVNQDDKDQRQTPNSALYLSITPAGAPGQTRTFQVGVTALGVV